MEANEKYSLGTTPILTKLEEIISQRQVPIDTIFVNAETLMRNSATKETVGEAKEQAKRQPGETVFKVPAKVLASESWREIQDFCTDIIQLFNTNQFVVNPTVVLYLADYSRKIPDELRRPLTESKQLLELTKSILQTHFVKQRTEQLVGKVKFIQLPIFTLFPPYNMMTMELVRIKNQHNVALITNHPLDYHLSPHCSNMILINSFTGEIIKPVEFGNKVFKNDDIPFTESTHALFGDAVDFKSSISGSEKTKLVALIKEERWKLRTAEYIKDRLYALGIKVPFKI